RVGGAQSWSARKRQPAVNPQWHGDAAGPANLISVTEPGARGAHLADGGAGPGRQNPDQQQRGDHFCSAGLGTAPRPLTQRTILVQTISETLYKGALPARH